MLLSKELLSVTCSPSGGDDVYVEFEMKYYMVRYMNPKDISIWQNRLIIILMRRLRLIHIYIYICNLCCSIKGKK